MPGLFANGSTILDAPMSTRPAAPAPPSVVQPADQYWSQSHRNLSYEDQAIQREQDRERQLERGRGLAGFVHRDRRAELDGPRFSWEQTRAPGWPSELPAHIRQALDLAITADRTSRAALSSAEQSYQLWVQAHPTASDELRRVKYEESTIDQVAAAQKAAQQLDQALVNAAIVVNVIESWQAVESTADARRAAADRQHQATLDKIDTELMVVRQAVQRAGVKV